MREMKVLTAEEVKAKYVAEEELYIIDVREDFEVVNGMIPNAVHIPMNTIPEHLDVFDSDREYIIVCASGVRSERVCEYLLANGIDAVNMVGGMYSWTGDLK